MDPERTNHREHFNLMWTDNYHSNYFKLFFHFRYVFQVRPIYVTRGEELKSGTFSKMVSKTDKNVLVDLHFWGYVSQSLNLMLKKREVSMSIFDRFVTVFMGSDFFGPPGTNSRYTLLAYVTLIYFNWT